MKRIVGRGIIILLNLIFSLVLLSPMVYAATDSSRSYNFDLSVNGGYTATVAVGDEISLEVVLERTDGGKSGSYAMYSMQDEIIYDSTYFALEESSRLVADGYNFNVCTMDDGIRKRIILSRLETSSDGIDTPDSLTIARFNLKTLQPVQGISIISKDYKVNSKNADTYIITANDVTVTISGDAPARYAVTFKGGAGAIGTAPTIPSKASGETFILPDNTFIREGYTFTGWNDGTRTYAAGAIYTMPARAVTFIAQWTKSSGGGTPGDGGGPGQPEPETDRISVLPVTIEGSTATLDIEDPELSRLLAEAAAVGPVTLDFSTAAEKISRLNIPSGALQSINQVAQTTGREGEGLRVVLSKGVIEFDAVALNSITSAAGEGYLTITIDEASSLTQEQKAVVQDNLVYDIRVETDTGESIDLNGAITVYLPYELKTGQSADGVVVYYVDGSGNLVNMQAKYDPDTMMAYFTTTHLSVYIIDYCPSAHYIDVDHSKWYHEAVDFAIEKGLFVGTSDATFEPNTAMSRAMLVTVLWRLEGSPTVASADSFEDVVSNTWYRNAVAWANANKIVSGYGNGLFGPNDNVTREQMAAILYRYAEIKGHDVTAAADLTSFTDAVDISIWALPSMEWAVAQELITGVTKTTLEPGSNATRAQVAMVLMRFMKNILD